jgi:serine/threonine-protein kinase
MADRADREKEDAYCEELVAREWATREQVTEAVRLRDAALELGQDASLDAILVKKGWLTAERATSARRVVAAKVGRSLSIGKYEILGRLGEGGAGIVYRAFQTTLGREVALKVLSKEREGQEEYLDRFLREARVAVTLNHVNIVRGLDFGNADGYHYFAMELVEGESFLRVIQREGRLSEAKAIDVTLQMVRALEHAQKYRIVHRDIKPENILVTKTGTAKLCDLGLARPIIQGGAADAEGRPMGTALYVAPEQIRQESQLDFRADIYSLGATLYHALTGAPPFAGKTSAEIVRRHLDDPVPNPRDQVLDLSTGAASVVMKMLAKTPAERYQTLEALDEDLDAVLDGRPPVNTITIGRKAAPMSPEAAADMAAAGGRRAAAGKKGRGGAIGIAVVSLAVAGGAAFFFLRPKPEEPPPVITVVTPTPTTGRTDGGGSIDRDAAREAREKAATDALVAAEAFGKEAGEDSVAAVERLRAVFTEHDGTSAARVASQKADVLDAKRNRRIADALAAHQKKAATALAAADLGAAWLAWKDAPAEWEGTPAAAAVEAGRKEILDAGRARLAGTDAGAAAVLAGNEAGIDELRKNLAILVASDLPEVSDAAEKRLAVIEASVTTRVESLAAAEEAWAATVPLVVLASREGVPAALRLLEEKSDVLAPVAPRVTMMREALADTLTFLTAVRKGFEALAAEGGTVRLRVPSRPGGVVTGRAAAVKSNQFEIQRGPAVEAVDIEAIHTEDLATLAWSVLGAGTVRDHRGAALFHMARGSFSQVALELKALDVMDGKKESAFVSDLESRVLGLARSRADEALKEAEVLVLQKRLPDAKAAFAKAVALCEGYARSIWMQGAFLLATERDVAPALALLEQAVALDANAADAWFHLAQARRKSGNAEGALEALEAFLSRADEDNPLRADATKVLAEVRSLAAEKTVKEARDEAGRAYRKEQWAESEKQWLRVLKFVPDDLDALYFLAKSHLGGGNNLDGYLRMRQFLGAQKDGGSRVEDAKKLVKDMEKRLGDNPAANRKVLEAAQLDGQKKYREAVTALDEAIGLAPLKSDIYVRRGWTLQTLFVMEGRKEDLHQAARDLAIAVSINDRDGNAWSQLSLVRLTAEDWKGAAEAARVAMERDTKSGVPAEVLARSCNKLGLHTEAEEAASQGIRREPKAMMFILRAAARVALGKLEEARADLDTSELKYELTPGERAERAVILGQLLRAEKARDQ